MFFINVFLLIGQTSVFNTVDIKLSLNYLAAHIHIRTVFTCDYIHMSCSFKIYEHLTTLPVDTNCAKKQ
jgi:hypothetical protein